MSERWGVEVLEGDEGEARSYVFTELPITIGRHEGNDVRLPRPFVSAFHARIERAGGVLCVLDLDSTNGVRARRAGGKEARIASREPWALDGCDDELAIGAYRIRIRSAPEDLASDALSLPSLGARGSYGAAASVLAASLAIDEPSVPHSSGEAGRASRRRACEATALLALEELTRSLAPGQRLDTPGDVAQLISRLQLALELSSRGLVRLRRAQQRCVSALRLPSPASDVGIGADDPEQLTRQLLNPRLPVAELRTGLRAEFQALARHQVALLEGMIQGAGALLDELSPDRIEAQAESSPAHRWRPLAGKLHSLRRAYLEHHAQLRRKDGVLSLVFGRAFRDAYAAYLAGACSQASARSARGPRKLR
jgi:predicted component of type VI protein secretion system